MGLLVGVVLYPVISTTKRHRIIVWAFRLAAIPLAIVLFVVLIRNFYKSDPYAGTIDFRPLRVQTAHFFSQRALGVAIYHASLPRPTIIVKGTSSSI